jgi:hypothetical protein
MQTDDPFLHPEASASAVRFPTLAQLMSHNTQRRLTGGLPSPRSAEGECVSSHDGRLDNRKPLGVAVDFSTHTVWQHEERVCMAEIHAGDDRDCKAEFVADNSNCPWYKSRSPRS